MASDKQIDALLNHAMAAMLEARQDKRKGQARAIRRGWEYGGGKKKAAKVGIGLAIGGVALAITIGTGGAGAALIAGVAAGAFAASQLSDAGFAKLAGRSYRGAQKTESWIHEYRNGPADQRESVKSLDERAHKTVRRAFEHYRRAVSKAQKAKQAFDQLQGNSATCDDLRDAVFGILSVSHHLDKARLYAHPALFLCQVLLTIYEETRDKWENVPKQLRAGVGKMLDDHKGETCGATPCFAVGNLGSPPPSHPQIWAKGEVAHLSKKLSELEDKLDHAPLSTPPQRRDPKTHSLWDDAKTKYEDRSLLVKMKHGIQNPWARKTTKERVAFGVGKTVSVGLSGAGMGGALGLDSVGIDLGAWDILVELGFQTVEFAAGEGVDKITSDDEAETDGDLLHSHRKWAPPTADLDLQSTRARVAASTQDELRKAAVHIYEIHKIVELLQDMTEDDCDEMVEKVRQLYKIEHHLSKVQEYLHGSTLSLNLLVRLLALKIEACNKLEKKIWKECDRILSSGDHSACEEVCYGRTPPLRIA